MKKAMLPGVLIVSFCTTFFLSAAVPDRTDRELAEAYWGRLLMGNFRDAAEGEMYISHVQANHPDVFIRNDKRLKKGIEGFSKSRIGW